jgi:hypothetical protein
VFGAHGIHLQCAVLVRSDEPFVRAASLAVLTCFMSPFECKYNFQLFFMALLVNDGSFLVRFHFVLLVKKFISSLENYSQIGSASPPFFRFSEIHNWIFDGDVFDAVDRIMKTPDYKEKAYHATIFLLGEYAKDPHVSVSSLAVRILEFVAKRRTAFEAIDQDCEALETNEFIVSYSDDEFEAETCSFANLGHNEALHQIALRTLVVTLSEARSFAVTPAALKVSEEPILFVGMMHSGAVVAATQSKIFAVHPGVASLEQDVDDIQVFELVLFTASSGAVGLWDGRKTSLDFTARIETRGAVVGGRYFARRVSRWTFATARDDGVVGVWNWLTEKLVCEMDIKEKVVAFDAMESRGVFACQSGTVVLLDWTDGAITIVTHEGVAAEVWAGSNEVFVRAAGGWEAWDGVKWRGSVRRQCQRVTDGSFAWWQDSDVVFVSEDGSESRRVREDRHVKVVAVHNMNQFVVFGTEDGVIVVRELEH